MVQEKELGSPFALDLVEKREQLVKTTFGTDFLPHASSQQQTTIGIAMTLMTHTLLPLYYNFFKALGFDVKIGDTIDQRSIERKGAPFCYPVEISHGAMGSLIAQKPDFYFTPHVRFMFIRNGAWENTTCSLVHAEPYYLKTAFDELDPEKVLIPSLNFNEGYEPARTSFVGLARSAFKLSASDADKAYSKAVEAQEGFHAKCSELGQGFLEELAKDPEKIAIVLFGRPYNAFTGTANLGVNKKFASRGYAIVPHDFIFDPDSEVHPTMYWASGQTILRTAAFVKSHPQLFAVFITNFGCGPDSFILSEFRLTMGSKPSLTLELDSHSADAGIDTRIEAFLDVISSYRKLTQTFQVDNRPSFVPLDLKYEDNHFWVKKSDGSRLSIKDPKVKILIPSMGEIGSRVMAAAFRSQSYHAIAADPSSKQELAIGRNHSSCKECLPSILMVGTMMKYLQNRTNQDDIWVYFMLSANGPCRLGQYNVYMKNLIKQYQIPNAGVMAISDRNNYKEIEGSLYVRIWQSAVITEILDDIYSAILILAKDRNFGIKVFKKALGEIEKAMEQGSTLHLYRTLIKAAAEFRAIERKAELPSIPTILLTGEIFVRCDSFARGYLVEKLAEKGIRVKVAPVAENAYYFDYKEQADYPKLFSKRGYWNRIRLTFKKAFEISMKKIFANTGFYEYHLLDMPKMLKAGKTLLSIQLPGEAIQTVGSTLSQIGSEVSGVIAIAPFGCMPGRIAGALLHKDVGEKKRKAEGTQDPLLDELLSRYPSLPYLSLEVDGHSFPQVTEAKLEAFCLQTVRVHSFLRQKGKKGD